MLYELNANELYAIEGGINSDSLIKGIVAAASVVTAITVGAPIAIVAGCVATGYYITKAFK